MPTILQQAMNLLVGDQPNRPATKSSRPLRQFTDNQLIKLESEIGKTLFGDIPKGHKRDFFCLDEETWIWHEVWTDKDGHKKEQTIRYEIHPNGILKVDGAKNYNLIKGQELLNLTTAIRMYRERVMRELYKRDHRTGALLTGEPGLVSHHG
ncbi:MAG: hypothetical protein Q7T74_03710 [Candidatus Saccharibacteria bacterium]|nr:hypothetical protein [Candidatus Saccharibacteria bacterium]